MGLSLPHATTCFTRTNTKPKWRESSIPSGSVEEEKQAPAARKRMTSPRDKKQLLKVKRLKSAMRDEEREVADILLEMASGFVHPGRNDERNIYQGSSSFPSSDSQMTKSKRKPGETEKSCDGDGINLPRPGGVFNEQRKLILIPPKQRPPTPGNPDAEVPFGIMQFLSAVRVALTTPGDVTLALSKPLKAENGDLRPGHLPFMGISNSNAKGNFVFNSHEKDTSKSIPSEFTARELPSLAFHQIMQRLRSDPGDARILEIKVHLQDLLRGVLRIFSSIAPPQGITPWNPLVVYDKSAKLWSWVGPVPSHVPQAEVPMSPEAWGMRRTVLNGLVDCFGEWLNTTLGVLKQIASLHPPPLLLMAQISPHERFKETRNLKNCIPTIEPSCEEVKAYFHLEEGLRYSIPEQAFSYTTRDGRKSTVAPLKKPSKKAREHIILKPDRPPSFTILCLVRDAAARLPHGSGTSADICTLVRDSQFVKEDATDSEIKRVVSGALDRLQDECDPCITFRRDQFLWSYCHGDKEEEDFGENCTLSAKKSSPRS